MQRSIQAGSLALALFGSGCATYSFGPPEVNLNSPVSASKVGGCTLKLSATDTADLRVRSVENAQKLIDNFMFAYRCDALTLADGRQDFEVPALLALVGGATAAALGTGRDVAIATGSTASLYNAGKGYYAPQQKARILNAGWAAIICIKSAANGIKPIDLALPPPDPAKMSLLQRPGESGPAAAARIGGSISIAFVNQYYEMVEAALIGTEHIMAERLSSVGSYAPDAILTELKGIAEKADAAAQKRTGNAGLPKFLALGFDGSAQTVANAEIKLDELGPELDACVVKAKT